MIARIVLLQCERCGQTGEAKLLTLAPGRHFVEPIDTRSFIEREGKLYHQHKLTGEEAPVRVTSFQ